MKPKVLIAAATSVFMLLLFVPPGSRAQDMMEADEREHGDRENVAGYRVTASGEWMLLYLSGEQTETADEGERIQELSDLLQAEEEAAKRDQRLRRAGTITLGTAVASLVLFNLFWILADKNHERYGEATTPDEARTYQSKTEQYETLSYIFGAVGLASLGVSIPLFAARSQKPEIRDLEEY
jgi:hypothetical protein